MQDIIRFILTLLCTYFAYLVIFYTAKRARAIIKLSSLKKECDAKITYFRMPYLSYFKLSSKPDAAIEIGERIYLIRFINGKGGMRFLHFASQKYFVTFSRIRISVSGLLRFGGRQRADVSHNTSRHSVKILPEFEIPEQYSISSVISSRKIIPVLIFNPAPNEVTYVTESKTSIKAAFEGDDLYGQMVFTPSAFLRYADRVYREEKRQMADEFVW
ncbi:MAG: hypothetical protein E7612_10370 [Ruminococcaceae bacterium]|nr:hypothetical protein [Oscillospiraceae bacterium]